MLDRQTELGLTDRQVAERHNWVAQTFSRWKLGSLPRPNLFPSIAAFLNVPIDTVRDLVEDAAPMEGAVKNVSIFGVAGIHGVTSDRKTGKYHFRRSGRNRTAIPTGRYAIMIETEVMTPALVGGSKAWVDPSAPVRAGSDVLVHADNGKAWIGKLLAAGRRDGKPEVTITQYSGNKRLVIRNAEAIHVIVLSERVSSWSR